MATSWSDEDMRLMYEVIKLGEKPKMALVADSMDLKPNTCRARYNTLMAKLAAAFPEGGASAAPAAAATAAATCTLAASTTSSTAPKSAPKRKAPKKSAVANKKIKTEEGVAADEDGEQNSNAEGAASDA